MAFTNIKLLPSKVRAKIRHYWRKTTHSHSSPQANSPLMPETEREGGAIKVPARPSPPPPPSPSQVPWKAGHRRGKAKAGTDFDEVLEKLGDGHEIAVVV